MATRREDDGVNGVKPRSLKSGVAPTAIEFSLEVLKDKSSSSKVNQKYNLLRNIVLLVMTSSIYGPITVSHRLVSSDFDL